MNILDKNILIKIYKKQTKYILYLICLGLVKHLFGTYKIKYHVNGLDHEPVEIDFTPPYKRISLLSTLEEALGKEDKFPLASQLTTDEANKFFDDLCKKHHVECTHPRTIDRLIDK
ncbi:unnamed protein product, partial [Rotaria sordida]